MLKKVEVYERWPTYKMDGEFSEAEIEVSGREYAWIKQTQEAYDAVQKLMRERVGIYYENEDRKKQG